MPQTEWDVADDRKLRAQLQSVKDFVQTGYYELDECLAPGSCYTDGTVGINNSWPSVAFGTGADELVTNNAFRPRYWTYGKLRLVTQWAANNVAAAQVVRVNLTITYTNPADVAVTAAASSTTDQTLSTTAWTVFTLTVTSAAALSLSGGDFDAPGFISAQADREGTHANDNYGASLFFLSGKLLFIPTSPVAD